MDKYILLWGHTGSVNRGCDAIVKSTADLIRNNTNYKCALVTNRYLEDKEMGESEFDEIIETIGFDNSFLCRIVSLFVKVALKNEKLFQKIKQKPVIKWLKKNDAKVLIVGGDTYTHQENLNNIKLASGNEFIVDYCVKNKIECYLWACSIDQGTMQLEEFKEHFEKFNKIFPREDETLNNFENAGYNLGKIISVADPAFCLEVEEGYKLKNKTIAFNLSRIGCSTNKEVVLENYNRAIRYILDNTDYDVLLLPHVFEIEKKASWKDCLYKFNSDYDTSILSELYENYKEEEKVVLFNKSFNSKKMKSIIAQCEIVVTARTHVSIAAYSSGVPTVVVSNSPKSIGIAKAMYGTSDKYVINPRCLNGENQILDSFLMVQRNMEEIRNKQIAAVVKLKELNEEVVKTI